MFSKMDMLVAFFGGVAIGIVFISSFSKAAIDYQACQKLHNVYKCEMVFVPVKEVK